MLSTSSKQAGSPQQSRRQRSSPPSRTARRLTTSWPPAARSCPSNSQGWPLHRSGPGPPTSVRLPGMRYLEPGEYVNALADSVTARGGKILLELTVHSVGTGAVVTDDGPIKTDAIVLATGAELTGLARPLGVRVPMRAGRGYSFTVPLDEPAPAPIYLPRARIACSPYRGRLRLAGTMEFVAGDLPARARRIDAMVAAATPLLRGLDWSGREDKWFGGRPLTADGLPVVGATREPSVYVNGGHGMWGITQGPATGRLLAETIVTGQTAAALRPLDPLR